MKIQGSSGRSGAVGAASSSSTSAPVQAGTPSGPSLAGSTFTDRVQLSNLARLAAASGDSSMHVAKLFSLTATVSDGRYQVAADVLSNRIIDASTHISGGNYA